MSPRLDDALAGLLEDVDTAPEGKDLDAAFDALTDWVQDHRDRLLLALNPDVVPTPPAPTIRVVDKATPVLRGLIKHLLATETVSYIPPAVSRRGTAYIPTPGPDGLTEAEFQLLLEAEAEAVEERGDEGIARVLRADLNRRRNALEAQARRDAQLAALAPLKGRLPRSAGSSV